MFEENTDTKVRLEYTPKRGMSVHIYLPTENKEHYLISLRVSEV